MGAGAIADAEMASCARLLTEPEPVPCAAGAAAGDEGAWQLLSEKPASKVVRTVSVSGFLKSFSKRWGVSGF